MPRPAVACSICRCGDPTFNALGSGSYAAKGFQAALDWERFDKEQGDPAVETETVVENRITALVSYGVSERLTFAARVPFSHRELETVAAGQESATLSAHGLSDPEMYAQVQLWASRFAAGMGRRTSVSLIGGVKTAWGENDVQQNGARLDEHAQPGTGSTDWFLGASWLHLVDKDSAVFASLQYRHPGTNEFAYTYGRPILANLAYEHKLGHRVDGVVELNFRHAKRDSVDTQGTVDEDTGGSVLYVTPRVLVSLGKSLVLRGAVQVPVVRDLYGFQKERAVLNAGVTYLFGR
jgi:hypothetical protein